MGAPWVLAGGRGELGISDWLIQWHIPRSVLPEVGRLRGDFVTGVLFKV